MTEKDAADLARHHDRARVFGVPIEIPPLWLAAFVGLGWALAEVAPIFEFSGAVARGLGWAMIVVALALAAWAALAFRRRDTSVIPGETARALVTDGPYRFSRNPIYVADVLILIGAGLLLGSIWPIVLTPAFIWVVDRRFIRGEEAMLRREFSPEFDAWSQRVRRWL